MFLVDTNVISVELIRYRRDPQQAALLEQWLEQVLLDYGDRALMVMLPRCGGGCGCRIPAWDR